MPVFNLTISINAPLSETHKEVREALAILCKHKIDVKQYTAHSKRAHSKGADSKGADSKGVDSKGVDSKGADSKGADSKGADSKGAHSKDTTPKHVTISTEPPQTIEEQQEQEEKNEYVKREMSKGIVKAMEKEYHTFFKNMYPSVWFAAYSLAILERMPFYEDPQQSYLDPTIVDYDLEMKQQITFMFDKGKAEHAWFFFKEKIAARENPTRPFSPKEIEDVTNELIEQGYIAPVLNYMDALQKRYDEWQQHVRDMDTVTTRACKHNKRMLTQPQRNNTFGLAW
jgi:hypothetical protein